MIPRNQSSCNVHKPGVTCPVSGHVSQYEYDKSRNECSECGEFTPFTGLCDECMDELLSL